VLLQWDRLSTELSSGRATHFTVIITVANGPLDAVPDGRETVPRRCTARCQLFRAQVRRKSGPEWAMEGLFCPR
jgi:hypothetical protein